jgi:hypothetical protein
VWANSPETKSYLPAESGNQYLYDSARPGGILVVRQSVGVYRVFFGGLDTDYGVAQASAYGSAPSFCAVGDWVPAGFAEEVDVLCFDSDGRLADTEFVVNFADGSDGVGRFSYLLADEPSLGKRYQPSSLNRYDSTGGVAWILRQSPGHYQVYVPASSGTDPAAQLFQVTAFGGLAHCKMSAPPSAAGIQSVACRNVAGYFTVSIR